MKLVTGSSGFFGIHLVQRLLDSGEEVQGFDIVNPKIDLTEKSFHFVQGDVRNYTAIYEACHGVDVVYHNAAVLSIAKAGRKYWEINVNGTHNVLEACRGRGVTKLIYISSTAVYGLPSRLPIDESSKLHPITDYGRSKAAAEQLCHKYRQDYGMDISIIRPRTILGQGRLGIFQILFDWLKDGKRIYVLGSGNNYFQFISASDLAEACLLVTKVSNEDFNIGAKNFSTIRQALEALVVHAKTGSKVVSVNTTIARYSLWLLNKLRISPLAEWHYNMYDRDLFFDISKAERILHWTPKDGNIDMLIQSYDWYLQHYKDLKYKYGRSSGYPLKQGILRLLKLIS